MFQRPPFNPDTAASLGPRARDRRQALARQQQWFHLLTQRAAAIQFSLPIDWTCLSDRCERQQHHCSECFLHVRRHPRSRSQSQLMCPRGLIKSKAKFRLLRERRSMLSCRYFPPEVYRFSCDYCLAGFGYRSISGFERSFAEEHIADSHRHDRAVVSAAVSYVRKRCQRLGVAGRLRSLPRDRDFWQAFCPCSKSMRAGGPFRN